MNRKGMFTELMEISDDKPESGAVGQPEQAAAPSNISPGPSAKPIPAQKPKTPPKAVQEDINTIGYLSQNYRFTEDELRWLRQQSYDLTERLGFRVPQNTVVRIAVRHLRDQCDRTPDANPLLQASRTLKK